MANHQLHVNVGAISSAFASALQQVANATVGVSSPNVSTNAVASPSTFSLQPSPHPDMGSKGNSIPNTNAAL